MSIHDPAFIRSFPMPALKFGDRWPSRSVFARYGGQVRFLAVLATVCRGFLSTPLRAGEQVEPPLARNPPAVIDVAGTALARDIIMPFLTPPAEFTNRFGTYRSPLLFNDGSRVTSSADWPRRRDEIT